MTFFLLLFFPRQEPHKIWEDTSMQLSLQKAQGNLRWWQENYFIITQDLFFVILNTPILGTKFCLWLLDPCSQLNQGRLRSACVIFNAEGWGSLNKALHFPARNAFGFFFPPLIDASKRREKGGGSWEFLVSSNVLIFSHVWVFLEPKLEWLVARVGDPRLLLSGKMVVYNIDCSFLLQTTTAGN